jgi:hypothetical protein
MNQIELIKSAWRRILLLALSSIFMISCASNVVWYNPSRTQEQAGLDAKQCKLEAIEHGNIQGVYRTEVGDALATVLRENEIFSACMEAKGYSRTTFDKMVEQQPSRSTHQQHSQQRVATVGDSRTKVSASQRFLVGE